MSGNNAGMGRRKVEPLLARDVYADWKVRVKDACDSIVVFTPYLDALVVRLLFHSALDADRLVVVTDLSPTTGALNYLAQLRAIAKLLDRGISVRSLERLHAKVLMTDGKFVTVGSQNFTTFARNSHEATSVPETDLSDSVFVQTLNTWMADATPIDSELIELLLTEVTPDARIRLEDGREFKTPSGAAIAAAENTSYDGWHAWRIGTDDGQRLNQLRIAFAQSQSAGN